MSHLSELAKAIKKSADEGLPNPTAIFRATWPAIRETKKIGFSHLQIHQELIAAGVHMNFGYYRILYSIQNKGARPLPARDRWAESTLADSQEDQTRQLTTHEILEKARKVAREVKRR